MNKRLILVLALALVVGLTAGAYAEVQNVKVSGDITAMGVGRGNFALSKTAGPGSGVGVTNSASNEADLLSIARIRVDADLTDNVSATVRLLNERNWNGEGSTAVTANSNIGGISGIAANENNLNLDLAYVTLKEFLYSPLTLKLGRQELRFGNTLIVGDPDTNIYSAATALAEGDLSARKSFDAIRATLDYNPLVIDGIYAKIQEGNVNLNDDVTLMGLNAAYELDKNTTLEGYFFSKIKGSDAATVYNVDAGNTTSFATGGVNGIKNDADKVNVVGLRAANKTVNNLNLDAQVAYQFGTYNPKFDTNAAYVNATQKADTAKRSAWAFQANANYDLKDIKGLEKYVPVIGAGYTYLSGADRQRLDGKYRGWDPMFEDQTTGHIMNAVFSNTNMHRANFSGKAKLTDDIGLKLDYVMSWFAKKYTQNDLAVLSGVAGTTPARIFRMDNKRPLGQEIDATLTYDYTEDVQFSLLGGVLLPSRAIQGTVSTGGNGGKAELVTERKHAAELIGSMKVTF